MYDHLRQIVTADPRIGYALVFGSFARGTQHAASDVDIAIGGLTTPLTVLELGDLIGRLEAAAGRAVDLTLLDEAPPGLAYRVFRDGKVLLDRDHDALAKRKARAVLDYLDWKPIEDRFVRAGHNGSRNGR
ncbi:MAG: nucleotidyltransferase domain-containing protein [Planctomycetota bacterium]